MQFRTFLLCLLLGSLTCSAQQMLPFAPADSTRFFVDSVETFSGLSGLTPNEIAMINVVKSKKEGVPVMVYVETKPFARRRYTKMLGEVSPAYAAVWKQYGEDSTFQYILDGAPILNSPESMLVALEKKGIADITILDPKELKKQYKIKNKKVGVAIRSK